MILDLLVSYEKKGPMGLIYSLYYMTISCTILVYLYIVSLDRYIICQLLAILYLFIYLFLSVLLDFRLLLHIAS
jgi:hypothetical protein